MLKVVIDTNVLISSLFQRSYPNLIINHCVLEDSIDLCVSDALIEEYIDVVNSPKFNKYPDFLNRAEFVISQIVDIAIKYTSRTS